MDQQQHETDVSESSLNDKSSHHATAPASAKRPESVTTVDSDEELEGLDRLVEDLVLHEGDGKISRPLKPIAGLSTIAAVSTTKRNASGSSSTFQKLKDINRNASQSSIPSRSNNNSSSSLDARKTSATTEDPNRPSVAASTTKAIKTPATSQSRSPKPPPRLDGTAAKRTKPPGASKVDMSRSNNSQEMLNRVRQKSGFVAQESDLSEDGIDAEVGLDNNKTASHHGNSNGLHAPQHHQQFDHHQHQQLTTEDIEIFQRLEDEYGRALEEREIGYNARYTSVRQSAFLSVFFLLAYMIQGTVVFMHQTEWTIHESLFFSIFTITTVGYGKEDLPTTPAFQAYTIFYIMIGVAALTIVVRCQFI